jgi:hypothetical protein
MINLAGHKDPDPICEEELFIAGIAPVRQECFPTNREVKTRVTGQLGGITFHRAWYYWVADGDVPLDVAHKMYAQEPYGKRDVRVAGHCGCPPPEEWAEHRDANGKRVILLSPGDRDLVTQFYAGTLAPFMNDVILKMCTENTCVTTKEERDKLSVSAFVTTYHIDSQAGLKVFADAMRERLTQTDSLGWSRGD